jgi:starch phosphorylase
VSPTTRPSHTNHTLLPEALETWPLEMFGESLPRHLEIIYEINRRFLDEVRAKFPGDDERVRRMSLIGEDGGKKVRMAHLATVGSHAMNGVTPRRFLALANPGLRELLDRTIGEGWLTDLGRLRGLEPFVDDASFRQQWRDVKRNNKARLARYIQSVAGVELNPNWLFDIQVKRIHEYKRPAHRRAVPPAQAKPRAVDSVLGLHFRR